MNQILCCIAWRPDWADDVIDLANDMKNNFPCAVVGVDIAAGEEHFDKVGLNYDYFLFIKCVLFATIPSLLLLNTVLICSLTHIYHPRVQR